MREYAKDPDANLDWTFSWADWLAVGETISTASITATTGISIGLTTTASTGVTVWLSGGTSGEEYDVTCRVTTSVGRIDDRTIRIRVTDR